MACCVGILGGVSGPQKLLKRAIARSGLSARQFAVQVMARNERTVRRWLAGESPMSPTVVQWLKDYLAGPDNRTP